ncbi:glycosyltransferase [Microbulbifer sp. PSTR4-B]|uniref:glycosyltransferase n=1 Tax=Microbulbifer sp. PSTR4-B TaxID=3243396 RepID=UPI004039E078
MKSRFSIIAPCYNNSGLLRNMLKGFSVQNYPKEDFEVIVVDNNSSDSGIYSCYKEYKDKLNLTLLYRQILDNPFALNSARNLGVKISKYDWCVFTDSDCIPSSNYLMLINNIINNKGKIICMTGLREFIHFKDVEVDMIDGTDTHLSACPRFKSPSNYGLTKDRRIGKIEDLPDTEQPWGHFYGCNMIYKKEDIIKVGMFDEFYDGTWGYDDIDMAYRVISELKVEPIFADKAVVYHQDEVAPAEKIDKSVSKTEKLNNPNYQYICKKINGYYEFSTREFRRFGLTGF